MVAETAGKAGASGCRSGGRGGRSRRSSNGNPTRSGRGGCALGKAIALSLWRRKRVALRRSVTKRDADQTSEHLIDLLLPADAVVVVFGWSGGWGGGCVTATWGLRPCWRSSPADACGSGRGGCKQSRNVEVVEERTRPQTVWQRCGARFGSLSLLIVEAVAVGAFQ
jgi:hypothetical protein